MDSELDRTLNQWDEKSCAEFEAMLDARDDDQAAYEKWVADQERRCE